MTKRASEECGGKGSVELIKTISTPFVTLVIADLLGVPAEGRQHSMNLIQMAPPPGSLDSSENDYSGDNYPMVAMAGYFARYIMERQQNPATTSSENSRTRFTVIFTTSCISACLPLTPARILELIERRKEDLTVERNKLNGKVRMGLLDSVKLTGERA